MSKISNKRGINELVKIIIGLYNHCHALIHDFKDVQYNELKSLFEALQSESSPLVKQETMFHFPELLHLPQNVSQKGKSHSELKRMAEKLALKLKEEHVLMLICTLLKLMRVKGQQKNAELRTAIYLIADCLKFSCEGTMGLERLYFGNLPSENDFSDSILITYKKEDELYILRGLKVLFLPESNFRIWVRYFPSTKIFLLRILNTVEGAGTDSFHEGEVLQNKQAIEKVLQFCKLTPISLAEVLSSSAFVLPTLHIHSKEKCPEMVLDRNRQLIGIYGVSIVQASDHYYEPLFLWLKAYQASQPVYLQLRIQLNFYNVYTSKVLLKLVNKIVELENTGCITEVFWHFEDDDLDNKEAGEHYEVLSGKKFHFIAETSSSFAA